MCVSSTQWRSWKNNRSWSHLIHNFDKYSRFLHREHGHVIMTSLKGHSVSNHQQIDCLLNSLFWLTTIAEHLSFTLLALCQRNPSVTSGLPSQWDSNVESASLSRRQRDSLKAAKTGHGLVQVLSCWNTWLYLWNKIFSCIKSGVQICF